MTGRRIVGWKGRGKLVPSLVELRGEPVLR